MISLLAAAALSTTLQVIPCTELLDLELPDTQITSAQRIEAGRFEWPAEVRRPPFLSRTPYQPKMLPSHCQVHMVLTPTPDSEIKVELWLPEQDWNGKFLAVGNGVWAGTVQNYQDMENALLRGYAVASSDSGHGPEHGYFSALFALDHPEKIVDFAYRSVHMMATRGKQLVRQRYDQDIEYSYFKGCSTGGRQALMSAQRYPGDFDGIIATAPASSHLSMHIASVAMHVDLWQRPQGAIDAATAAWVSESVLEHCDLHQEGFLQNPLQCQFDFASLQCGANGSDLCLNEEQLKTVLNHYDGIHTKTGEPVAAGQALGNPIGAQRSSPQAPNPLVYDTVRILGYQNADLDWRQFDLERDLAHTKAQAGFVDAENPDLRAFKAHGGKLILDHGWRDLSISPLGTLSYYQSVIQEMGPAQNDWFRLFLVPGMDHCGAGPGLYEFDELTALEQWREEGIAPDTIMASNPDSGIERPLCPHPSYAQYQGSGDIKSADNWQCRQP